jgi:cysteine desulfurase
LTRRVYLDWNATAPLRPEARAAMLAAMDAVGNPSSVHAEGRAARGIVERARAQVAALVCCDPSRVVFTSGATEANAMAFAGQPSGKALVGATEHSSVPTAANASGRDSRELGVDARGLIALGDDLDEERGETSLIAVGAANGETGVIEAVDALFARARTRGARCHCDATQAVGRIAFDMGRSGAHSVALSAHKLGGPKGVGAFIHDDSTAPAPLVPGGGQEAGWRGGTENIIGIAGFGAAAEAARLERDGGAWARVAASRDRLEARIAEASPDTIFFGGDAPRLPNTTCFATPGWLGELQVMQLDMAGFAVSSGSACSSGKVRESHVLRAMGFDDATSRAAIRVSLGPTTTQDEIDRFCEAWTGLFTKRRARAA